MEKLRHQVFWPSLLLLAAGLLYTLTGGEAAVLSLNKFLRSSIQALQVPLSYSAVGALVLCLLIAVSPLGRVKIGGAGAQTELTTWQYFSIALCTTVAVGILFWATAEPLYHLKSPPTSLGLSPGTEGAKVFAMSTLLQHWTFIPYSLYAIPSVLFALAFYNLGRPFRLSSCLYPLLGERSEGFIGTLVDSVCLFALVAGMAASLGAGILSLGGGVQYLLGIPGGQWLWIGLGVTVVASFVLSAISGLDKGVRILSDFNTKVFLCMLLFIALLGPGGDRVATTVKGFIDFVIHLVPRGLLWSFDSSDSWQLEWPLFYWTNWLAWAPMTGLFLGRISKGYTVRQMMFFTLILPSLFVIFWMGILGGSALCLESQTGTLIPILEYSGPESVIYAIFHHMPLGGLMATIFVVGVFISYVTAADSNTLAMAGLCWSGVSTENPNPPNSLKILWGCLVGVLSLVMICNTGIDGVKALSNLGGIPALFFEGACGLSLFLLMKKSYEEDTDSVIQGKIKQRPH